MTSRMTRIPLHPTTPIREDSQTLSDRLEQLDPTAVLKGMAAELPDTVPSWQGGTVDAWDGTAFEHTLSLLRHGRDREVKARLWRAQGKRKPIPTFRRGGGLSTLHGVVGEAVCDGRERVLL